MPLLSLYSLLFSILSLLLLSFFCVSSPPSPPKSRFDPVSEKDAVMVAATEAGGPSVLPVSVVPPWFSLYKALRMLPKSSFIFIHLKFPCRSVVASTNKFL